MTRSNSAEIDMRTAWEPRRPPGRPKRERLTFAESLSARVRHELAQVTGLRFPSDRYRYDPVAFFREVLGVEPWSRQVDIINAVRDHARVAVCSGHKVSKLLALDTPVPTPTGWSTIGELRAGDTVFAETGAPCRVLGVSPIETGTECYAVTFDDGTRVVTDGTHAWRTWTSRARLRANRAGQPRDTPGDVTTTAEIRATLNAGRNCGRNHSVVVTRPVECPAADLPMDPYELGVQLGAWGVMRDVPAVYMRGGIDQRRALLMGLMDARGFVEDRRCRFNHRHQPLAAAVFELAASLGLKPRLKRHGRWWSCTMTPNVPVFRLPYKLRQQRPLKRQRPTHHWTQQRVIVSVDPVPSVPVRCIEVDSPSHLFLVSRAFVPTHNSHTAAGLALWYYCSFSDARVVMTSTTSRQVDQILWRELRIMRARSGRCTECKAEDPEGLRIHRPCPHSTLIDGEQGELARTGLKASDFREIVGFTAREAEAVAGISGRHLLYIVDEASGVGDDIFEAIEGNRAGGARIAMFSNGTKNEGEFYEAFHSKSQHYFTLRVSSEETPNVVSGEVLIPGLATREWIEEKRLEWGEESSLYRIRIKGEHPLLEEGRIFSVHLIGQAEARWAETPDAGRLFIGLDPAGESGKGDESMFAPRRGLKLLGLRGYRGLSPAAHVTHVVRMLHELRLPREVPVLVVDREGPIGTPLFRLLGDYLAQYPHAFELVGVRASDRAVRQGQLYDRIRDELAANLESWFRDGGAIVEDTKLAHELHVLEWTEAVNGRLKLTPKDKIKKQLGRSPDRYDALALACWEPLSLREPPKRPAPVEDEWAVEHVMDPYAAEDTWRSRG